MIVSFVPKTVKVAKHLQLLGLPLFFLTASCKKVSKPPTKRQVLERYRCVPRTSGRRPKDHGCGSRLFWPTSGAQRQHLQLHMIFSVANKKCRILTKRIANFRHANCSSLRLGRLQNQRCSESIWLLMTFLCAQRNANIVVRSPSQPKSSVPQHKGMKLLLLLYWYKVRAF